MPSIQKPAGYFTTFSILDPNGTHEGSPRTQKRNRRVFVCVPCHRRKLKCDKGQPCSRCTQSGSMDECVYQPLPNSTTVKRESVTPEPNGQSPLSKRSPRVRDQTRSSYRVRDGKARVSGSTHWAKIACEVCLLRKQPACSSTTLSYLSGFHGGKAVETKDVDADADLFSSRTLVRTYSVPILDGMPGIVRSRA